ncbi:hypothetical protein L2E82_47270 [Cichorium intybus]|uniref:Uncharacterized protein n=1 Tax=Cichorium intybus TaxID=13427 RepID=A0ACB8YV39_CICIN|nr:hypothetical protein L2E82_47270 [Cichorium intybus]
MGLVNATCRYGIGPRHLYAVECAFTLPKFSIVPKRVQFAVGQQIRFWIISSGPIISKERTTITLDCISDIRIHQNGREGEDQWIRRDTTRRTDEATSNTRYKLGRRLRYKQIESQTSKRCYD